MRTLEEIEQQITDEKTSRLPELNSSSSTAIYRLWISIVALAIFTFEQIFEKDKNDLIDLTERRRYGTLNWYADEVKNFQFGDELVVNSITGQFYYEEDHPEKRIVVQSAVNEEVNSGALTMKVARLNNGDLAPLLSDQMVALKNYLEQIKVAGTNIELLSLNPDEINLVAEVYYDGNLLPSDVSASIQEALVNYKENATFNGIILKNELIEIIRSIPGVDDVFFTTLTGKTSVGSPIVISRDYSALSGYFVFAPDFMDSWTFIPRFS